MYSTPLLSVFPKPPLPQETSLVDSPFVSSVFTPLSQEMFPVDHQVRYYNYTEVCMQQSLTI